jgi:transposase-like protein
MIALRAAIDYVTGGKVAAPLRAAFARVRSVVTFTQERANRVVRYIAIVRAYKAGVAIRDIENRWGCSRSTVLRYARSAGLAKRERGLPQDTRAAVLDLYRDGRPVAEIAETCGVSQAYVSKEATAAGINRRTFSKRPR